MHLTNILLIMRQLLNLLTFFFLIMTVIAACNKDSDEFRAEDYDGYYWSEGKKIPLQKMNNKFYVMFYSENENKLYEELAMSNLTLSDVSMEMKYYRPLDITNVVKPTFDIFDKFGNCKFANIYGSYEKVVAALNHTLYWTPYYKNNDGLELWVSYLINVELKPGASWAQLKRLAGKYNLEWIEQESYSRRQYTLFCNNQSKGNALQIANLFHNSGLFDYVRPPIFKSEEYIRIINH